MSDGLALAVAGVRVTIRGGSEHLGALRARWASVPAPEKPAHVATLEYDLLPAGEDELTVRRDGEPIYTACPGDATSFLELDVYREVAHAAADTPLHAAALTRGGRAALLAGASGAGKSSLALALAARGWAYLGDEHAFLGDDDLVRGFPRAVRVGEERAESLPGAVDHGPAPIGLVALLDARRAPGAPVTRVAPAVAAVELLAALHRRPGADDVRRVTALAAAAPVVRLAVEGVEAAANALLGAWPGG